MDEDGMDLLVGGILRRDAGKKLAVALIEIMGEIRRLRSAQPVG